MFAKNIFASLTIQICLINRFFSTERVKWSSKLEKFFARSRLVVEVSLQLQKSIALMQNSVLCTLHSSDLSDSGPVKWQTSL